MSTFESILIIIGISLDIFAAMEIHGAMLADVKKKTLAIASVVTVGLQLLFFLGGYGTCYALRHYDIVKDPTNTGEIAAIVILALLGLRLVVKAIKREFVHERRTDKIRAIDYARLIVVVTVYTFGAGCASGLLGTNLVMMMAEIVVCSVLVVTGGIYTGYRLGFENKTIAYALGACFLWFTAAEILLRGVLQVI